MIYENKALAAFKIIGIAIKTTNQGGQSQRDIGELWEKFMRQNIIESIPNKENQDIYCLYTDYESDHNGAYTTVLGCKVSSFENLPEEFIGREFPAEKYQVYTSKGKLPDCVGETWTEIWQSKIDRKYLVDFDVYGQKSQDFQNAEVETFLSVN